MSTVEEEWKGEIGYVRVTNLILAEEKSILSKPPVLCANSTFYIILLHPTLNLHNTLNLLSTITGEIDVAQVAAACRTVCVCVYLNSNFLEGNSMNTIIRKTGHDTTTVFTAKVLSCLVQEDQKI